MAITSSQASASSGTSITCTLPTGTIAGDTVVAFACGGFGVTGPGVVTGWTQVWYDGSTTITTGGLWWKVMTSGDISAGNMTINWSGGFSHITILVKIPGAPTIIESQQSNSGGPTTLTATSSIAAGNTGIYFSGARDGGNISGILVTPGSGSLGSPSPLESVSVANADAKAWYQVMPGGSQANVYPWAGVSGVCDAQIFFGTSSGGGRIFLPYGMDGLGKFDHLKGGING